MVRVLQSIIEQDKVSALRALKFKMKQDKVSASIALGSNIWKDKILMDPNMYSRGEGAKAKGLGKKNKFSSRFR